ncbi:MAG: hypothetical protein ABIQ52_21760 [Vicinamibacterales bacterium]
MGSGVSLNGQVPLSFQRQWQDAQKTKPLHLSSTGVIAPASERGTPLIVRILVSDAEGKPVAGAEAFGYQTDDTGIYARPGSPGPWRLKGWGITDAGGRLELRTIRPGPYPSHVVPAHIHLTVTARCCGHQFTDLMFDDDVLATPEFRARFAKAGEHGLYGGIRRNADGSQEVTYTIRLRERGEF